jgi:hypothetical protein
MVKLLIKNGANPKLDSNAMFPITALSYAKLGKHNKVSEYLIKVINEERV